MFKFDKASARKWDMIIIHHSQSPDSGNTYTWDQIAYWHVRERGFNAIGYHLGMELEGGRYVYCIGRGLDCVGAHTQGQNDHAIGICLCGNFDKEEPLDCQYWMLAELCKDLMRDFNISIENIRPHREFNKEKTCPGNMFSMDKLISKIKNNGFKDGYSKGSEVKDEKTVIPGLGVDIRR